ncbi:MAG: cation:proton antiporter [Candidatus Atribacteria bacterium]|jgi:multicomponent Na+:H+ antiporter subunit F|nr:cation:proton antiporter [Candidatus Atribacteria bacterium]
MGEEDSRMTQLMSFFLFTGALIAAFIILPLFRLIVGPTIPDKVIALDTINTYVVAAMILFGAAFEEIIYIDVAIVYALLSYITTLYIAKFIERRAKDK